MFVESSRDCIDCSNGTGTLQRCRSEFIGDGGGIGGTLFGPGGSSASVSAADRALLVHPAIKYLISALVVIAALIIIPFRASALNIPDNVQKVLDDAPLSTSEFTQMSLSDCLSKIIDSWKQQIENPIRLLTQGCVFLLIGAAVSLLAPSLQWRETLETVMLAGMFLLCSQPILDLMGQVTQEIQNWYTYLVGFVPVFSGVMISCGQNTSAMLYSGMFLAMANFSAQAMHILAMPLLQIYLALSVASGLCGIGGIQDACGMIEKAVRWILKFVSTLFGTVLGLQTILTHGVDNIAFKASRFVVSSTIPVVGVAASDAMDSVLSALKVLKGSMGFAAIAVLAVAFVPLLLRCVAYACAVALCSVLAKACGFDRGGQALEGMAKSIRLCISFLVFFFMLVVLATALMILTGNGG